MRPLRAIINAAIDGERMRPGEVRLLGQQLDVYWRDRCRDCRHEFNCDDLLEDRCANCRERVEREGA